MNYYIADLHLFHKNMTAEGKNLDYTPRTLTEILDGALSLRGK